MVSQRTVCGSLAVLAALTVQVSVVAAHEGHGDPLNQHGVLHYAAHPSHFLPWLLAAGVAVTLFLAVFRRRTG